MPDLGMTPKTDYVDGVETAANSCTAQRLNDIGNALAVLRDFIVVVPTQAAYDALTTSPSTFYFVLAE